MPEIRIPEPWQRYTGGQSSVTLSGQTVGAVLQELGNQYPELSEQMFADGELRTGTSESVNVLLGKYDYRELDGPDTAVAADDRLVLLRTWPAAMSGPQAA